MKILFLAERPDSFLQELKQRADILWTPQKLSDLKLKYSDFDFLISFGYRFLIKADVLANFENRAMNLHISLLPWNRGADPNFWSFFENTPKGVSIHHLDEGLDTGDLIVQRELKFSKDETLASSYQKLQSEIQKLFWAMVWPLMESKKLPRIPQKGSGSFHKSKDLEAHRHLLAAKGWDTPVLEIEAAGRSRTIIH